MRNSICCTRWKPISLRRPALEWDSHLPSYISESRAAAEKSLAGVLDPKWSAGRTVIQAVVEGSPKVAIIQYARKHDIDLIVLATHGRTGFAPCHHGSVAETVCVPLLAPC